MYLNKRDITLDHQGLTYLGLSIALAVFVILTGILAWRLHKTRINLAIEKS